MSEILEAIFDGEVLRPVKPIALRPNSRVKITIETAVTAEPKREQSSFLQTACSLNLEGPADWAENIDAYLYGEPGKKHG